MSTTYPGQLRYVYCSPLHIGLAWNVLYKIVASLKYQGKTHDSVILEFDID